MGLLTRPSVCLHCAGSLHCCSYVGTSRGSGDAIDYGQRRGEDLGAAVDSVLEVLERSGGKGAFPIIKRCIPTYLSTMT